MAHVYNCIQYDVCILWHIGINSKKRDKDKDDFYTFIQGHDYVQYVHLLWPVYCLRSAGHLKHCTGFNADSTHMVWVVRVVILLFM